MTDSTDCDDGDANITDGNLYYVDGDNDGFGTAEYLVYRCELTDRLSENADDCDDRDSRYRPDAIWYEDKDRDGYGNSDVFVQDCYPPYDPDVWYTDLTGDCDDNDPFIYPYASCVDANGCLSHLGDLECECLLDSDDDGDGVCNTKDVCNGADDSIDEDNNGIPDCCAYTTSAFPDSTLNNRTPITQVMYFPSAFDLKFTVSSVGYRWGQYDDMVTVWWEA